MAARFDLLPLAGFTALMIVAAVVDFRRLVIPNAVVAALCMLWLVHIATARGGSLATDLESAAAAIAVLAAGAVLFARSFVGGGDVKLLAAASLWAGGADLPGLLMTTALLGGVLGIAFLTPLGRLSGAGRRVDQLPQSAATFAEGRTPIPYGVAIAAAALIVTIPRYFN